MNKRKVVDIVMSDLKGKELVQALEAEVAAIIPFDHSKDTAKACGFDKNLDIQLSGEAGTISQIIETLEQNTTKRELAYMLVKTLLGSDDSTRSLTVKQEVCKVTDIVKCMGCENVRSCKSFKDLIVGE